MLAMQMKQQEGAKDKRVYSSLLFALSQFEKALKGLPGKLAGMLGSK